MSPFLLAAASLQSQPAEAPRYYPLPAAALADLTRTERPSFSMIGRRGGRRSACPEAATQKEGEMVVCAEDDSQYRVGEFPETPEAPTFTGERRADSAFEASRCANRCPPQPMIDVIGGVRTLRRGLGRIFGGD